MNRVVDKKRQHGHAGQRTKRHGFEPEIAAHDGDVLNAAVIAHHHFVPTGHVHTLVHRRFKRDVDALVHHEKDVEK